MLEGLISSVLNRVLGNFIENLGGDQLNISLWNGSVKLENLQVKPNLFDSMPFPFVLHYGKVGKIFLDIPVTRIQSQPIKIEISDVFLFIKPKHFDLWSEKVEKDAFVDQTTSYLDKYEAYLTESTQLEQSNPGMMSNLVAKIIDNIQIKITNIYVRIEDELSIPSMPFAMGVIIGSIEAETMNDNWRPEFIADRETTNRAFAIKDFAVYMNYGQEDVLFDEITKDWQEKDDKKYMRFLRQECAFENPKNNYIIDRFKLDVRANLNKNMKNLKPQVWVSIALGGEFIDENHTVISAIGKYFFFAIQQQQIAGLMKFTEYIGNYSKFQAGVLSQFFKNEMTPEEEKEDQNKVVIDALKTDLRDKFERNYAYDKILLVRTIATKQFEKLSEEAKVQLKITEAEQAKQGYMSSLKGWMGYGKTKEQEDQEQKEIEEMKKQLEREAKENIEKQGQVLEEEIQMLKRTKTVVNDQKNDNEALGADYVQFDVNLNIPEFHILLKRGDGSQLIELIIEKIKAKVQKGFDFLDAGFTLHTFKIKDHFTQSNFYPYLLETYIPMSENIVKTFFLKQATALHVALASQQAKLDEKNAMNIRFVNNPRINKVCSNKLTLHSDAQLFLFANLDLIFEVQDMFNKAMGNDDKMIDYYQNLVSEELFKYVYEGGEFMMTLEEKAQQDLVQKKVHAAILLDLKINAPVIFIQEHYKHFSNNPLVVVDFGKITIDSKIVEFNEEEDYFRVNNPFQLYDAYNFNLQGMQVLAYDQLKDYKKYKTEPSLKIFKDVELDMNFYQNLEPKHPVYPAQKIYMSLKSMNIMTSDYIFKFMMKLKETLLAKLPKPSDTKQNDLKPIEEKKGEEESIKEKPLIEIIEDKDEEEKVPDIPFDMVKSLQKDESIDFKSFIDDKSQKPVSQDINAKGNQSARKQQKPDTNTMSVEISIGNFILEIQEQSDEFDYQSHLENQDQQIKETVLHQELLKILMQDLVLNYDVGKDGKQIITLALGNFNIEDRSLSEKNGKIIRHIPDCYSNIMQNPQYHAKMKRFQTKIDEAPKIEVKQLYTDKLAQGATGTAGGNIGIFDTHKRYASSRFVSINSNEFISCASEASINLKIQDIERDIQFFAKVVIDSEGTTTKQEIDLVFSDLRMIISLATFEKLLKFQKKLEPSKTDDQRNSELFAYQQNLYQLEKIEKKSTQDQKSNFAQALIKKNVENTYRQAIAEKIQEESVKRLQELKGENGKQKIIQEMKRQTKLKFNGKFKNLELWMPLDARDKNSRAMSFSLMTAINYRKETLEYDYLDLKSKQIVSTKTELCREDAIVTLNQLQILMINRQLLVNDEDEPTVEKLVEPSRITFSYDNLLKDGGLKTWMSVDLQIEPFELKVGFREVEFFQKLNQNVQQFLTVMNAKDDLDITQETEIDIERELNKIKKIEQEELQKMASNQDDHIEIKNKEQIKVFTVKFRCDTFRLCLMDDTSLQEYPVIFLNIKNVKYDSKQYEDIDDAGVFILKKMGILKKKSDTEEPYINTSASVNIEIYYFNMSLQTYEPFLEPWAIEYTDYQEEKYIPRKTSITSSSMLNMNITFALMQCLNKIQEKMAQSSEDWEEEQKLEKVETKSISSRQQLMFDLQGESKPETRKTGPISLDDNQAGFVFINKLGIDLKLFLKGQEEHDKKARLLSGIMGDKKDNDDEKEEDLRKQLKQVDDKDPKAHFKKLGLIRRITKKRNMVDQIEKCIFLEKQEPENRKFRKADELFYLMKTIKKAETKSLNEVSFENEVMKVEMKLPNEYQKNYFINDPMTIELGGIRSIKVECKYDQKNPPTDYQTIQPTAATVNLTPIAILCNVKFESQLRKEVEFQSALLFSNQSQFALSIYAFRPQINKDKKKNIDVFLPNSRNQSIDKKYVSPAKVKVIQPNQVFNVPLTWFIKHKAIYYKRPDDHFDLLFSDVREYFPPDQKAINQHQGFHIQFLDQNTLTVKNVGVNISLFKCKPTTAVVPGQYLVTFTPPICVSNYLFSDLNLQTQTADATKRCESKSYFYVNDLKFDRKENGLGCLDVVQWSFAKSDNDIYMSQKVELFNPKKVQCVKNEMLNPIMQVQFKSTNEQIEIEELKSGEESYKPETSCIINFELAPFNLLNNEYDNFELRDKVYSKNASVILYVYPQAMIVNQTNVDILIKSNIDDKTQKLVFVKSQSNEFFFSSSNKASIKVQNYNWSKIFDTTTLGLTGAVEVKINEKEIIDTSLPRVLNFGILIENGTENFSKTKIIKIVPRYMIYNNLDDPIIIKQKNSDQQILVPPKEKKVYQFSNKEKDAFIMIRDMDKNQEGLQKIEPSYAQDETQWSSQFSIEDIEDFQTEFNSKFYQVENKANNRLMSRLLGGSLSDRAKAWHLPSEKNYHKRIVRVTINTQDDATIFVIITKPKYPEYYLSNHTDVNIEFTQFNCKNADLRLIKPGFKVPFVWRDQTLGVKKLTLKIDGKEQSFVIDKLKSKKFQTSEDLYFVDVVAAGDVRTIEIRSKKVMDRMEKEKGSSVLAKMFLQSFLKKGSKFILDLKGIGVSLIDNEPKELIYISIFKLNFLKEEWNEQQDKKDQEGEKVNEKLTKYELKIDHIQIDNVLNDDMPVLFCPTKELIKDDNIANVNDYTPFIQVMVTYSEIQDQEVYIKKYRGLQVAVQEMKLQIETGFVNALMKFIYQIQASNNLSGQFMSESNYYLHKTTLQMRRSFQTLQQSREQVCTNLKSDMPENPDMTQVAAKKMFFELVHFGGIKNKISVRFEKKAFELKIDDPSQGFGFGSIFYTLFTTVATISDSPLAFKEVLIVNTYTSQQNLTSMLTRNYARQGVMQFYKLIGSSDLLGNPVGLIDKLGTGVFEFFNEPRKGLLLGPKEFVGGVGKGVKSLVTNVVSGGFDSVSKITGSLYGVVKNVSGDKTVDQNFKQPEHALDGVYQGLKGGATEIAYGLTGIFTKPYKKAKEEGAKGLVKGIGAGLLGAVASPFAATLRLGNTVSTGIKNSAIRIGKGKLPTYGRFRHPRHFNSKSILEPYAEALSEANQILKTIKNGLYANTTIRFFSDFSQKRGKEEVYGILIITDQVILYVEEFKKLKFQCQNEQIEKVEVWQATPQSNNKSIRKEKNKQDIFQQEQELDHDYSSASISNLPEIGGSKNFKYHLHIYTKKNAAQFKIENDSYGVVDKVYSILKQS